MSRLTLIMAAALLVMAGTGAGAGLGYWRGQVAGQAKAEAKHDKQAVSALTQALAQHADLVEQSRRASQELRQAVAMQQEIDLSTTKDLADALAKTAGQRAGCRMDAGIVRQLDAARERAARAAAGGIAGAVPATAGTHGR